MTKAQLTFALAAGAVVTLAVSRASLKIPGASMTQQDVLRLAELTSNQNLGARVDPVMAATIAFIESSFNPTAVRPEIGIGDASVGLMQTLVGTAQWLYDIQGYRDFPRPDLTRLFDPEVSMYFGMAYLDYLANRNSLTQGRGEETIVRGYNGGPGGASASYTDGYWLKYVAAKSDLFDQGVS